MVNKNIESIKPYKVASHRVWHVSPEERENILKLDWNEATCESSPLVRERLSRLLKTEFLNLYPNTNNEEIYDKLSDYLNVPKHNIQYFGSSDSLHEYISRLYITPGDNVVLVWPSYDNFRLTIQVAGGNVKFFELGDNYHLNQDCFEKAIEDIHPKLVYICNPNNPTGSIIEKEYITKLINRFKDTLFLIDEAYIEFCPDHSCKNLVLENDNIIITRTLSKAFGLANIRFGYIIASEKNIEAISKIRNPKNITTFAQEAAIGALSDVGYMKEYVKKVNEAKPYFINAINSRFADTLKAYGSYGNFVLVECEDFQTKCNLLDFLEKHNIFIRALNQSESMRNCVRVTIGTLSQMRHVIKAMEKFIQKK